MSEQYQFVVRKGPKVGQIFRLIHDSISIGRDPLSDIVINDPEISRQHAKLVKKGSGYTLEDFGSTNGTYIDGSQMEAHASTELLPGQLVSMGSGVVLLFAVFGADTTDLDEEGEPDFIHTPAMQMPKDNPVEIPPLPEIRSEAAVSAPRPLSTPLVPSVEAPKPNRWRTVAIIMIVLFFLLIACALSAYFVWGDPLMRWLGVY
ncbi:MAG: FHA domain-containing protein [Chloroflexota bacterium]